MSAFGFFASLLLLLAFPAFADFRTDFTPVTDQGDTLQCWAVSLGARLDITASRAYGAPLKISPKYLVYKKIRAEVLDLIDRGKFVRYEGLLCESCKPEPIYYEQGGILLDGLETARVFGVVPEEVYGGFPSEDLTLFRSLNRFIARSAERGAPRTQSAREGVARELEAILDRFLGHPPERFAFQGYEFTPRSFFDTYLSEWKTAQARELDYAPRLRDSTRVLKAFDGMPFLVYTTGSAARLRAVISETLKAGQSALLQYKAYDDYHTQAKGHIGFAIQSLPVVKPNARNWYSPKVFTHYVLAIGGEWDPVTGDLKRILVKNTWGVSPEEGYGFHWIEEDFLPWLEAIEIVDALVPKLVSLGLLPEGRASR